MTELEQFIEWRSRAEIAEARNEVLEGCVRLDRKAFDDMAHGCSFRENDVEKAVYERSRTAVKRIDAMLPPAPDPRSGPDGPVADHVEGYKILPGEEDEA